MVELVNNIAKDTFLLERINLLRCSYCIWLIVVYSLYKNIGDIIKKEGTAKFMRVLDDAGVFKRNEQGMAAFKRFIEQVNCK